MSSRIKGSCLAVVVPGGYCNRAVLIAYFGGDISYMELDVLNIWHPEVDNSIYIEDIFSGYEQPPDRPGFYVWEGELEYVYDDQPRFFGKWRTATKEDMIGLLNA